jgi:hypothetical protein
MNKRYNFVEALWVGSECCHTIRENAIKRSSEMWFALVGRVVAAIVQHNPTINRRYAVKLAETILKQA